MNIAQEPGSLNIAVQSERPGLGQILCCSGNASKTETRSHEGNSGTKTGVAQVWLSF
jgi:hypothetical protein